MPRHGKIPKRKISPDPIYGSVTVQKFINKMMMQGKKSKAETIIYSAMELVSEKLKKSPLEVFEKALKNITPFMEVKPRRVGGSTYQVPIEVAPERGEALAMKWVRQFSRSRSGKSMVDKLSAELMDAYNGTGNAMKKKEDTHRMAEANKAFAHFRW
jgi:small subunit ribosomal protein S7